jgi:hypothetical protein
VNFIEHNEGHSYERVFVETYKKKIKTGNRNDSRVEAPNSDLAVFLVASIAEFYNLVNRVKANVAYSSLAGGPLFASLIMQLRVEVTKFVIK